MRLFWLELKKIFSIKILLLIGLVNFLLFFLLLNFDLEYFPNGHPSTEIVEIEKYLIPLYGEKIDDNEFQEIKSLYSDKVAEADALINESQIAKSAGITNYQEHFDKVQATLNSGDFDKDVTFGLTQEFLWEIGSWEYLIELYETREESLAVQVKTAKSSHVEHFKWMSENSLYSFYTDNVTSNFKSYKRNMAIIIFISVTMLMALTYLRDTRSKLVQLQYTSKYGRATYKVKWLAGMAASALLTLSLLILYMALYSTNGTSTHFELPLSSFGWYNHWYDMTFLNYILVSIFMIFLFSMLLAILTLAISTVVGNTIVLIGIQILVLFVMIMGVSNYLIRDIFNLWLPQALLPSATLAAIVFTAFTCVFIWKREMRRDLTN